jgi:hypothetical protein
MEGGLGSTKYGRAHDVVCTPQPLWAAELRTAMLLTCLVRIPAALPLCEVMAWEGH